MYNTSFKSLDVHIIAILIVISSYKSTFTAETKYHQGLYITKMPHVTC